MSAADRSSRLALGFSCLGHTYAHLFAPIFYVVALTLEGEFGLTHGETITLVVAGNVLFGLAAPLAGWIGDRWRAGAMMSIYFLGCGTGMVLTGLAPTPFLIMSALALTGLFGSIYHPVGIAWLVRNARNRGTALGINGVFGGIGPGVAVLLAGVLTDALGWRAAFVVPGLVVVATGLVFQGLLWRGVIVERREPVRVDPPAPRREAVRAFSVLMLTMLCTGLIYQATQAALPKMFSERMADFLAGIAGGGVSGAAIMVALVYFAAGASQVAAGWLADRYPLRFVYLAAFILQVPVLALAATAGGGVLLVAAMVMVSANVGALPAENSLVARYAPPQWHGLAFGLKFIIAFGLSGFGAKLEAVAYDLTGGFFWLFTVLTAIAAVGAVACLLLPPGKAAREVGATPVVEIKS